MEGNGYPPDFTPPDHFRRVEKRLADAEDRIAYNFLTTNAQTGEIAEILLRIDAKLEMVFRIVEGLEARGLK